MRLAPLLIASLLFGLGGLPLVQSLRAQEPQHEESELARHMEQIEDTVKVLRKNLKEPATRPAALAALQEIQQHSLACKALVPTLAAKLPAAEQAGLLTDYRRTMVAFLTRQLELEAALLDGDDEAAKAAFERFREMEDSAHERFAPEDE
jgi:hypothetical protein